MEAPPKKKQKLDDTINLEKLSESNKSSLLNILSETKKGNYSKSDKMAFTDLDKNVDKYLYDTELYLISGVYLISDDNSSGDKYKGFFKAVSEPTKKRISILTYVKNDSRGRGYSGKAKKYFIDKFFDPYLESNPGLHLISEISSSNISSLKSLLKFNRENAKQKFYICEVKRDQVIFSYPKDNIILGDETINKFMEQIEEIEEEEKLKDKIIQLYLEQADIKYKKELSVVENMNEDDLLAMIMKISDGKRKSKKRKSKKRKSKKRKSKKRKSKSKR